MTIEEAISHAREVAENKREEANETPVPMFADACDKCAEEHEQLAEWLEEYKFLRTAKETVYKEIYIQVLKDVEEIFMDRFDCDDIRADWTNADIRETIHFELEQLKEQKK